MPISIEADPTLAQGYIKVNGTTAATISTAGIVSGGIPAGAVMPFAMNSAPSGWLAADGTAVSRSTYAALFAAIGTTHGSGDGSTTFNLPDLRGIFVRGSGSQTISGTTYSGTFAQRLRDQMQKITGSFRVDSRANNNSMVSVAAGAVSISDLATADGAQGLTSAGPQRLVSFDSANSPDARVSSTTDGETRPANIALLYCIKH